MEAANTLSQLTHLQALSESKINMNTNLFYPAPPGLPEPVHPSRGDEKLLIAISHLDWAAWTPREDSDLLRSGALWLYGFLEESHEIAQQIGSQDGSYWHALMHRSEGDFANSKYWYRRVGSHIIFPQLYAEVDKLETVVPAMQQTKESLLAAKHWDPFRLVDIVERVAIENAGCLEIIRQVVRIEYELLMKHCLKLQ